MKRNYTYHTPFLLIFSVLLFMGFGSFGQGRITIIQEVSDGYDYIAYIPAGYDQLQISYPVLVYLHGGQGILDGFHDVGTGDPKAGLQRFQFGPPNLINNLVGTPRWPTFTKWPTQEFIVIMPHLPRDPGITNHNNQLWDPLKVEKAINDAFDNFMLDEDRFYMTGISLGAKGVYDYVLLDAPDRIPAAVIPISGNAEPFSPDLCGIKDIYLWALHGTDDGQVPLRKSNTQPERFGSLTIVEEYNKCNNSIKARLDTLQGVAHTNWNEYYDLTAGFDLYSWLSDHSKDKAANLPPYVSAGKGDLKILFEQNRKLTLYGYGYDSEQQRNLDYNWILASGDHQVNFLSGPNDKDVVVEFAEPGTYEFELQVSDGTNTVSDQKVVEVLEQAGSELVLNNLQVQEGNSWRTLKNGDRINVANPGTQHVVLRSVDPSGSIGGVTYTLNENTNNKTIFNDSEIKDGVYLHSKGSAPFKPKNGEYIISATPFKDKNPASNPGITKQFAIYVNEDPPVILPVEFLDVNATRAGNKVSINWSTASEQGNDFFTIERSPIALDHFEAIGTQEGAGDSKELNTYTFTDYAPLAGDAYYRIKQTDFDGKSDYSKIVKVKGSAAFEASLFPNPTEKGLMFIRLSTADVYTSVSVNVMDAIGNLVHRDQIAPEKLMQVDGYKLVVGNKLNPGLYFVIIEQGDKKVQKKLIVQ